MMAKYDAEIKNLRCKIDTKDIELINLKTQLTELRHKNTKVHSTVWYEIEDYTIEGTRRCKQGSYKETTQNLWYTLHDQLWYGC
jgi:hypothetical protein